MLAQRRKGAKFYSWRLCVFARVSVSLVEARTIPDILLGECKWGRQRQGRKVVEKLIEKAVKVVPENGDWTVHYACFSRQPLTLPARAHAAEIGALQVSPDVIAQDSWRWMMYTA